MSRITDYPSKAAPTNSDIVVIVDVADTTQSPQGSVKQATVGSLRTNIPATLDPTGTVDSSTAINNALALGGTWALPDGTFLLNQATGIALSVANSKLRGNGFGTSTIKIGPLFSGTQAISMAAASTEVSDLAIVGNSSSFGSNPTAMGVSLNGFQHCRMRDLWFQYVNNWCISSVGAALSNIDTMITRVVGRNCSAGLLVQGASASSFGAEHFLTDIQLQQMGATTGTNANMPAFQVQDANDILVQGLNIGMAASVTSPAVVIEGSCATVAMSNIDVGANAIAGGSPSVHITSTVNGSPSGVKLIGRVGGGLQGVLVDAGSDVDLNLRIHQAYSDGLTVSGTPDVLVNGCRFAANGQGNVTAYDINHSGMTGGSLRAKSCTLESPVGTGAALVTNPVSTNTHGYFRSCDFVGTGTTPSTVFNGTPQVATDCVGYNPRGSVTAPTVGTSPYTPGAYQTGLLIVFTAINGMSAFAIGGTSVPTPAVGVPIHIPARQTVTITWATTAPTWQWLAD